MVLRELSRSTASGRSSRTSERPVGGLVAVTAGTVVFGGEVDVSRSEDLAKALETAERVTSHVVVDLRTATLLDSTCVSVLTDCALRLRERGGRLMVLTANRLVRRVLRMTFADELLEVQPPFGAADDRDGPTVLPL